mgnify:CR=1 FL=1
MLNSCRTTAPGQNRRLTRHRKAVIIAVQVYAMPLLCVERHGIPMDNSEIIEVTYVLN